MTNTVKLILNKGSCSHRSSCFEYAQLLLSEHLRVCKILVWLTEVRTAHDLLRHHQIIVLGPVHSFGARNVANDIAIVSSCASSNVVVISNLCRIHSILYLSLTTILIFCRNFRATSLDTLKASTHVHHLGILNSFSKSGILAILFSYSATHHVGLGWTCSHVRTTHYNIVFLDNSDTVLIGVLLSLALVVRGSVVLLGVDDTSALHLRILYFDLRVVENVIVVINVLDDLDWLLLVLLFWLA